MKYIILLFVATLMLAVATPTASAKAVEEPIISMVWEDVGGWGWSFVAGPVWMNGPYGYGRYCWYYHQQYGHAVLPC